MENFYSSLYCQDCSDEDPRLWRYFARSLIPNHRSMWRPPMLVTDHQSATNSKCKCQIRTFPSIFNKFQMQMPYPRICLYFSQNVATKNLPHIGPIMLTQDFIKRLPKFALSKQRDRKPLALKHDSLNTKQPIKVDLVALMDSVKGRLKDGLDSFRVGNS